jgi:hypothetical protein
MKRLIFAVAAFALSQTSLFAADVLKGELFGGYAFINNSSPRMTTHGWEASYQFKVDNKVGIVGDVGGYYKGGVRTHTFMGGPQVNFQTDKANVFGRALFGGVAFTGGHGFLMGYGGGIDIKAAHALDVRVVQFDWLPDRVNGVWDTASIRLAFGVVVKPGGK